MELMRQQQQELELKEALGFYNLVVAKCFKQCVKKFSDAELSSTEKSCIEDCGNKIIEHYRKCGEQFAKNKDILFQPPQ